MFILFLDQHRTMADDDLGSFFAEISQIEAEKVAPQESIGPEIGPQFVSSVISKGAELSSRSIVVGEQIVSTAHTSHPVYTYAQPPEILAGSYPQYDSLQQYSTFRPAASSSSSQPPPPPTVAPPQVPRQDKVFVRKAADETWVDETLQEWPENDYRIFVGDLAKEVSTEMLAKMFQHYASYAKAKVDIVIQLLSFFLKYLTFIKLHVAL